MLLLLATACSYTPTVAPHDVGVRDLTLSGATVDVTVAVHNPLPASADVDVHWRLHLDGVQVTEGVVTDLSVASSADTLLAVPVDLRWSDLWAATGTVGQPLPWRVELDLAGHTAVGTWTVPYAHEGELPALSWPDVSLIDWRLDRFDTEKAAATLVIHVDHAVVQACRWGAHVGVVPLAHGSLDRVEGRTELPVVIEVGRAMEALQTLAAVGLGFTLEGEMHTPLGMLPVALDRRWSL